MESFPKIFPQVSRRNIGSNLMVHTNHCGSSDNSLSVLPDELILKIFLMGDGKTIGKGRCLSRNWYNLLSSDQNMRSRYVLSGGPGVVMHLDNPLKDSDPGRLAIFDLETRSEIHLVEPISWKWFMFVGSGSGLLCARYSADGLTSSVVVWNPFTTFILRVSDPGSVKYHFNHRSGWSAYSFVGMPVVSEFRIICLCKPIVNHAGYDISVFNSSTGGWTIAVHTPNIVDTLSDTHAIKDGAVFWVNSIGQYGKRPFSVLRYEVDDSRWSELEFQTGSRVDKSSLIAVNDNICFIYFERSSVETGIHMVNVTGGASGTLAWGRHVYIGGVFILDLPNLSFGMDLFGVNHSIRDVDLFHPSYGSAISSLHFYRINLVNGTVNYSGTIQWASVVGYRLMAAYKRVLDAI